MKSNSAIIKLSLAVAAAFTMVACSGTFVKLPEVRPAQLDLHRGSTIAVSPIGEHSERIADELITLIRRDGYYINVSERYPHSHYLILLRDNSVISGGWEIRGRRGGWEIQGEACKGMYVGLSWDEIFGKVSFEGNFARNIYEAIAPHEGTYSVRMNPDKEKNPTLCQAVAMAKAAQWERAKALAAQAIKEHPGDAEGYYVLGALLRNDSKYEASNQMFRKALSLAPKDGRYTDALKKNAEMQQVEAQIARWLQGN